MLSDPQDVCSNAQKSLGARSYFAANGDETLIHCKDTFHILLHEEVHLVTLETLGMTIELHCNGKEEQQKSFRGT